MVGAIPLSTTEAAAVQAVLDHIARSGATLTGADRVAVAELSRRYNEEPPTEPPPAPIEALVWWLTVEPQGIRSSLIADLDRADVEMDTYLEIVAVVSLLQAVDTASFALGLPPVPLPMGSRDQPNHSVDDRAVTTTAWVPTVGVPGPPNALSRLPDEHEAMHRLHGAFYLSVTQMADLDIERDLHRTQMELVAARTSALNECFY